MYGRACYCSSSSVDFTAVPWERQRKRHKTAPWRRDGPLPGPAAGRRCRLRAHLHAHVIMHIPSSAAGLKKRRRLQYASALNKFFTWARVPDTGVEQTWGHRNAIAPAEKAYIQACQVPHSHGLNSRRSCHVCLSTRSRMQENYIGQSLSSFPELLASPLSGRIWHEEASVLDEQRCPASFMTAGMFGGGKP